MSRPQHVYRVAVTYPTPDGRPFDQQPREFWEQIEEAYFNPDEANPLPEWAQCLEDWSYSEGSYELPLNYGYPVTETLTVPRLNRTHYLTPSGANRIAKRFREWGCIVTITRSKPIEWEAQ